MSDTPMPVPVPTPPKDPLRRHRTDLEAVEDGKWIDIKGDLWKVARFGCASAAKALSEALAEHGLQPNSVVPPDISEKVFATVFCRAILRDMRLRDAPDEAYTTSVGLRIYQDPELRDLRTAILQEAESGDYTKDTVAKAVILGNSFRRSDGN